MTMALYMDHQVPRPITNGLRNLGVDVVTAFEDGSHEMSDSSLLDRAGELQRVVFSQDDDFLKEAVHRQRLGIPFVGVIYVHQDRLSVGERIESLHLIAEIYDLEDLIDRITYLPL